jgi:hypothetical protein
MDAVQTFHRDAGIKLNKAKDLNKISPGRFNKLHDILEDSKSRQDTIVNESRGLQTADPNLSRRAMVISLQKETLQDKNETVGRLLRDYISDDDIYGDHVPATELFREMKTKIGEDSEVGRIRPDASAYLSNYLNKTIDVHDKFSDSGWTPFTKSLYFYRLKAMDEMYNRFTATGDEQMNRVTGYLLDEMTDFDKLGTGFEHSDNPDVKAIEAMYKDFGMQTTGAPKRVSVAQKLRRSLKDMTGAKTTLMDKLNNEKKAEIGKADSDDKLKKNITDPEKENKPEELHKTEETGDAKKPDSEMPTVDIAGSQNAQQAAAEPSVPAAVSAASQENTEDTVAAPVKI